MWPRGLGLAAGQGGRSPSPSREPCWSPAAQSVRTSVAQTWAQGVAGGASVPRAGAGLTAAWPLLVCLQDSVLAFWSHGMQGRSLDTNEVSETQEPGGSPPGCPHLLGEDPLGQPQSPFSSQVTQEIDLCSSPL